MSITNVVNSFMLKQTVQKQNVDSDMAVNTLPGNSDENLMFVERENCVEPEKPDKQLTYKFHVNSKTCFKCEKTFYTHCNLKRHLRDVHKLKRIYIDSMTDQTNEVWTKDLNDSTTDESLRLKKQTKYRNMNKDQNNKCLLCYRILSCTFGLKRHLLCVHKIAVTSTVPRCHAFEQKTNDNGSTIKNDLVVHNPKEPTMNTVSESDKLNDSYFPQPHGTQNKSNSTNATSQSNELHTLPIQNYKTHVAVNGWPYKAQVSQAQNYDKNTKLFEANAHVTQPSFGQSEKSCVIPRNKQELFRGEIVSAVPLEKNTLLDLPVNEQNHYKMLSTVDDTTTQSIESRAINAINDQSNRTNNVQMYSNKSEIVADTTTDAYNQNKQQPFNTKNTIKIAIWPNGTQDNRIQSGQKLQNCHFHVCNVCSMLFQNKNTLNEHKQSIHKNNKNVPSVESKKYVPRDKCMLDLSSVEKTITWPTEVTKDSYCESGKSNEVHNIQTHISETRLPVNNTTVTEESNKIQTLPNYSSNESQFTTSVLNQSNDVQTVQIVGNIKTHIPMNDWLNGIQDTRSQSEQTITMYKAQSSVHDTYCSADPNELFFESNGHNKKTLSANQIQINTDTTNVSYQPNETQTKQTQDNRTNVLMRSWPNKSQEILHYNNQSMNQRKAQPLNVNAIRTCSDESIVSNKSNDDRKRIDACGEQFKHEEVRSPEQHMLEKKINQFPVNNMLLNGSTVQKFLTNAYETPFYADTNNQLSEELYQSTNFGTPSVNNRFEFYDFCDTDILQSLYNPDKIGNSVINSVPYQPNEVPTVQTHVNESQINSKSWPNETQRVQTDNDSSIIWRKPQTSDTNSLKAQNSDNNFVMSNDNKQLDNEQNIISYSSDVCSEKLPSYDNRNNKTTVKQCPGENKVHDISLEKTRCEICLKSYAKQNLEVHMIRVHKIFVTNKVSNKETKHSDSSTTTDFENNLKPLNDDPLSLNLESNKPNKIILNSVTSQSNKDQIIPLFSNRENSSVTDHPTEIKIVKAVNNHTYNIKEQKSLESNQLSVYDGKELSPFCQICRIQFKFEETLLEHKKKHNIIGPPRVKCIICKNNFSMSSIRGHLKKVHNTSSSLIAKFITPKVSDVQQNPLESSQLSVYDKKEHSFFCKMCLIPFKFKETLLEHKRIFHWSYRVECFICKNVLSISTMKKHLKTKHNVSGSLSSKCKVVPGHDDGSLSQLNEKQVGETVMLDRPNTTNQCLIKDSPSIVQVSEDTCAVFTEKLKKADTYTNISRPTSDRTLQTCLNEKSGTSKTYTLLDQPKEVQIPKASDIKLDDSLKSSLLSVLDGKELSNVCQICCIQVDCKGTLLEHTKKFHGPKKEKLECFICKKVLLRHSIKDHLKNVHNESTSLISKCKVIRILGHHDGSHGQLNEERIGKTVVKNYQSTADKCLINSSPSDVQINQKQCKKTSAVDTKKLKEAKTLESTCKKRKVADDMSYTNDIQPTNDHIVQPCLKKKCVTNKPCTLLDQPKDVQMPEGSDNNSHIAANKCPAAVIFPTNTAILPTFDKTTQVKPHIGTVISTLDAKCPLNGTSKKNNKGAPLIPKRKTNEVPGHDDVSHGRLNEERFGKRTVGKKKQKRCKKTCAVDTKKLIEGRVLRSSSRKKKVADTKFPLDRKSKTQSKPREYAASNAVPESDKVLRIHLSDYKKVCEVCSMSFSDKFDYDIHSVTHNSWRCDECNMLLKSQSSLDLHKKGHSIGLYICGFVRCFDKSFSSLKLYSAHLKSHNRRGKRP